MAKLSPFKVVHERLGGTFSDYGGWQLVKNYGDEACERKALMEASAAFDMSSFGRITVSGEGSWPLIDGVLTGESEQLEDNRWVWAIASKGEKSGGYVVRVGRTGNSYILLTLPSDREAVFGIVSSQRSQEALNAVKVSDITEQTGMMGIYGPSAFDAVKRILPLDMSGLEAGRMMNISVFMMSLTILRGSWVGLDGIELICPASAGPLAAGAVARYHKKVNITPAGMDCLEKAITLGGTSSSGGN
jgi:aminomethyltransferase